jgi:hypothetical protein
MVILRLKKLVSQHDMLWCRMTANGVVIFSDESAFSWANEGPVLVYRPQEQRYNSQYMSSSTHSGRVSVQCWGWISHEKA